MPINFAMKYDTTKPDHSLIDPLLLDGLAGVLMYGANKYGRDNWRKQGLTMNRLISALSRHLFAILGGEDYDKDSGLLHINHCMANAMFIRHCFNNPNYPAFDDRVWDDPSSLPDMRNGNCHQTENGVPAEVQRNKMLKSDEAIKPSEKFVRIAENPRRVSPLGGPAGTKNRSGTESNYNGGDCQKTTLENVVMDLQKEIAEWADTLWPNRKAMTALTKMQMEEIPELIMGGLEPGELADVGILLFDIAHLTGIDLVSAIREKMVINRARSWVTNPETGLSHHMPSPSDAI